MLLKIRNTKANTRTFGNKIYLFELSYDYLFSFPYMPAALVGTGQRERRMPLEYLRALPYQSIDRRVLEVFELTVSKIQFEKN